VLCVPLDLHADTQPFGCGLHPGARPPRRIVTRALWRDAKAGLLAVPRIQKASRKQRVEAAQAVRLQVFSQSTFWPPGFDESAYLLRLPPTMLE
jgi:hypothetical protein